MSVDSCAEESMVWRVCSCDHTYDQHWPNGGHCDAPGCECFEFEIVPEGEDEEYTGICACGHGYDQHFLDVCDVPGCRCHNYRPPDQVEEESAQAWLGRERELEAESAAALKEHEEAIEEEHRRELCPCGHRCNQYYLNEGQCQVAGCTCEGFGLPFEEEHTEVNLGGHPGGFVIYE